MNSKIALLMAEIFSIKREVSKALKYDKSLLATKKKKLGILDGYTVNTFTCFELYSPNANTAGAASQCY